VPTLSLDEFRYLRASGYFVAFTTILIQIIEVVLRSWPAQFHSAAWRLSFIGNSSGIVLNLLMMVFLILTIASLSRDRMLALVMCGVSMSVALLFLVSCGIFALDALQMRNQVQMTVATQFDVTSGWTIVRELVGVAGFTFLAVGGWRVYRTSHGQAGRSVRKGDELLVGSARPTVAVLGEDASVARRH
jgi:uncharacterized membrane protein